MPKTHIGTALNLIKLQSVYVTILSVFIIYFLKPKSKQLSNCHPAPSCVLSTSKNNYHDSGVMKFIAF